MKTKLPRLTEAQFQSQVIRYAQLHGWRVAHFRPALTRSGRWITPVQADGKGFPDLLLLRKNEQVVVELKVGRNAVSPAQADWLGAFANANVPAFVWRPADWPEIEEVLQ